MIQSDKVRVIDENGENLGVMFTNEAIEQANEVGLNLVEVSPNADPPVCKFLDVGKYRYEAQKKANAARKTQKTQEIKEIKMRPNIDTHDYDVKMRSVIKFIDEGDKVKMTLRFRGREMAHQELGMDLLKRVQDDVDRSRQGRGLSAPRRPPDADGAGAQVRRRHFPPSLATSSPRRQGPLLPFATPDHCTRVVPPPPPPPNSGAPPPRGRRVWFMGRGIGETSASDQPSASACSSAWPHSCSRLSCPPPPGCRRSPGRPPGLDDAGWPRGG